MAMKVDNKTISKAAWGDVDKSALGKRLADAYAAGEVTKAQIREVYAYVPEDAFGTDGEGKRTFAYTKAWGPHHEVKGNSIVLNRGGVAGAAGALAGSRSEPSLSATELAAAKRHVRRHYKSHLKEAVPEGIAESLRKAPKGKPLNELVKGSLDYTMDQIWRAFRAQFKGEREWDYSFWIIETFDDHVIVNSMEDLAPDEYYYVPYQKTADGYVFADRDTWEVVELAYQPATAMNERDGRGLRTGRHTGEEETRFVERIGAQVELVEASDAGKPRRVKAIGITADVVNENGRRYAGRVIEAAIRELKGHLHESAGQGRFIPTVGEAEHPSDKGQRANLLETVIKWDSVVFDGTHVLLDGQVLETAKGKDLLALMEGGILPGVSQRGYGVSETIKEGGRSVEEVRELHITGYDLTLEPSDPAAAITMLESRQERETMDIEQLIKALLESAFVDTLTERLRTELQSAMTAEDKGRKEKALREALAIGPTDDLVEAVLDKLAERPMESKAMDQAVRAALGISDTEDLQEALQARSARLTALELAETKRQVGEYIAKEIGGTKYPGWMKEEMAKAVTALEPKSIDEAKAAITSRRKEYDAIMARIELQAMGNADALRVLGPVLERDTGVPEFARVSFELNESLVRAGKATQRDFRKPKTVNEAFAARALERFDQANKHHLLREAQLFQESELVADLHLPYSVSRAIIAEAFPKLIAISVFDVALMDGSPMRLYYESFVADVGLAATVTNEDVTADADTWVNLAQKRLVPGTVVVDPAAGGAAFSEGDDYIIDYGNGRFMALSTGTIVDGAALHADYTYAAIRKGEMGVIERGEGHLDYVTIEAAADRLAQQVSREAAVFARSQIGWDATTRTIALLIKQVQRGVDQGLFYMGLAASLSLASNSGGTWDHAADTLEHLVEFVGVAKVKVANRYYEPTALIGSLTNSDRIANWEGFTSAGARPDADLRAEGYIGRLKGLPCFESTEFPDDYLQVCNRELVMHRVLQPMQLFGPFPTYDVSGGTSKIVAADQYYVEEFNASEAPVPGKGAVVRII